MTKATVQAMASFRAGLCWAVGKGLGTEVWETSLAEPRESWAFLCFSPSAPFALQQLSGDPVPAELRVPLEYISLVGCSISVMAALLTILLYAHSR